MNRRDFGKQVATFGLGTGAMLVAPSAHATLLPPDWLVRIFYNQRIFGLVETGNRDTRQFSMTLPVPQDRMDLYRAILPKQYEVPDIPLIQIYTLEIRSPFPSLKPGEVGYEVGVNIRATYKRDKKTDPKIGAWHNLTLPVTSDAALQGGLIVGYPKYKAKISSAVSLDQVEVSTSGKNTTLPSKSWEELGVSWRPGPQKDPYADLQDGPMYVIRDGRVNIMETKNYRLYTSEKRTGPASAIIKSEAPWARLTDGMDLRGIATVEVRTGRFVLTRRSW